MNQRRAAGPPTNTSYRSVAFGPLPTNLRSVPVADLCEKLHDLFRLGIGKESVTAKPSQAFPYVVAVS
jgi:hypothetical protein